MSLSLYNKKRDFKKTAEPEGKEKSSKGSLRFVIQKHDASHVHYDFRLEMHGVLKSWAVPKGPSLNAGDKRLAMMVEDHPFAYRDFEGVIPAGEYGGGTVIVWDEGTYKPIAGEGLTRMEQEKIVLQELNSGKLNIILHGQKLKGAYTLFQMKNRGERAWILVKTKDAFSSTNDITKNEASVKSGKTLVMVAQENGTKVNHPEAHDNNGIATEKPPQARLSKSSKVAKAVPSKLKTAGKKTIEISTSTGENSMPKDVVPTLATLVNEPFDDEAWIFEIKWDGYRTVAYCNKKDVALVSRNRKPFTEKYAPVAKALSALKLNAVLDGELVAVNEKGLSDFQALQNWQNTPVQLQLFVFDILWLNGKDVTHLPLIERKQLLKDLLPPDNEVIKYSDHVVGKGKDFFKVALKGGLEGIMAKKASSIYQPDTRTEDWIKIKVNQRQEVVIAGYTQPRKTRKFFGSLLLGVYDGNELVYIGHTGSGFNTKSLEAIYKKLQPLIISDSPFAEKTKTNMPATWVKPVLVCEIKFTEWTSDQMARHPIFMGLRSDKKATNVRFEKSTTMAKIKSSAKKAAIKKTTAKKATASRQKKTAPAKKTSGAKVDTAKGEGQPITLDGHELELTNLNKIYWKKEGFSKGDMVNYYLQIAPYILPYLLDRAHSLNRHPNGVGAPNFYQKDVRGKVPEWIDTLEEFSESNNETIQYLVCQNEATLIYMANSGCIEINPWHDRKSSRLRPDWCLVDLDPDTTNSFEQVIDVANLIKKLLDSIGADSCVKTSGSTGIHIYIPLGAKYDFDQSKQLAELIVNMAHAELPELTSVERSPAKRKGQIYLDFLQNRETQTAAAPYSLRPKPGVPVSTPLHWSEVKKGLTPTTYTAYNIFERLKTEGDLFKRVLQKGIDLEKALTKIQALLK